MELQQLQIDINDLEGNINTLSALASLDITDDQWREILINEKVIGNYKLLCALNDYLLDHDHVETAEQLLAIVQKLKQQK